MWLVVYIASTKSEALEIENLLNEQGFMVRVEVSEEEYQIKVLETEAKDVYELLNNNL